MILLNSKSKRFPNGLGNDNGLLGKYIAFHNYNASINAEYEGNLDKTTEGRRPTSAYLPRFRNVYKQETDFLRGLLQDSLHRDKHIKTVMELDLI